jgi:hypothetical protein
MGRRTALIIRSERITSKAARGLLMFGMLDYRAYKLFWLIGLPLRIASWLALFVVAAISVIVGHWTGYHVL